MKKQALFLLSVLCLTMSIGTLSATEQPVSRQIPATVEAQISGTGCRERTLGVMAGMAVGALSPCSVFCAVGSFYAAVGYAFCAD